MKCIGACSKLPKTLTVILYEGTVIITFNVAFSSVFKKPSVISFSFQEMCKNSLCSRLTVAELLIAENGHDYFIYFTYL
jgi:hypothetical protein